MPDMTNYPVIQFADKTSNFNKRRKGLQINEYLVIAYCDAKEEAGSPIKIYKICTGLPVIDVIFSRAADASQVAEWISNIFGEFFPIWDKYPEADIFGMVKWTVPDGIRKYEAINLLSQKQTIDDPEKELTFIYDEAERYVSRWTYEHLG